MALLLGFGWWSAPKSLTIHVPPDLRSGSTRKWWDVPPERRVRLHVLHLAAGTALADERRRRTTRATCALSAYLTPSCRAFLQQDYEYRRATASCVSACAASTRFPAAATAMIRPRASGGFRPRLDRHARRERGRILRLRAGQARPGALPHQVVRLDIDPSATPSAWRWTATPAHPSASNRRRRRPRPAPANASGRLQGDSP